MELEQRRDESSESEPGTASQFTGEAESGDVSAWEEVASGRYMPRRIKGSCKGRALG